MPESTPEQFEGEQFDYDIDDPLWTGTYRPVNRALVERHARTHDVGGRDPLAVGNQFNIPADLRLSGNSARVLFVEEDAPANNQKWDIIADGEALQLRMLNDAESAATTLLVVQRTGQTIDSVTFGGPPVFTSIVVNGSSFSGAASQFSIDQATSVLTRLLCWGPDATTRGTLQIGVIESDGGNVINALEIGNTGAVTLAAAPLTLTGGQIAFPATANPSANANTLDDYEEGTFTPTGNGITFSAASGRYTKIGRVVVIDMDCTWPTTADTGEARFQSLPFTQAGAPQGGLGVSYSAFASQTNPLIPAGLTYARLLGLSGANITNANVSTIQFVITGTYAT